MGRILKIFAVFTSAAVCLWSGIAGAAQTSAQSDNSALAVTPSIVDRVIAPGGSEKFNLQIFDVIGEPVPVQLSVAPLQAGGYTYINDPIVNWLTFSQQDIILQPNSATNETVTIHPPAKAEPGGHYATIYVTPLVPVDTLKSGQTHQIVRIGVMLSVIVEGKIVEHESLNKFKVASHFQQSAPVNFSFTLHNSGNIHLLSAGRIIIYNYSGKQIASVNLPYKVTLPKSTKVLNASWNKSWAIGYFSAQAEEVYGPHHIAVFSQKVHFWIVPWLPISIYVVLTLLLIYFIKRTHSRWTRAARALFKKSKE